MNKKLLMIGVLFLVIALIFFYQNVVNTISEISSVGVLLTTFALMFLSWGFGIPQIIIKFVRRII